MNSSSAGFIGLGRMGRPMCETLLRSGFDLIVHNRSRAPVDALEKQGAKAAVSVAQICASVEIIFTCLLTPEQSEAVYIGDGGIAAHARPGTVCVDMATIEPLLSRRIGAELKAKGIDYLDAPVSGGHKPGPDACAAGTLIFMIGGEERAIERVRPMLEALSSKIFHLGPAGSGTTGKVCNQILTAVGGVAVSEAMVLGTKAGLNPHVLYQLIHVSSGQSFALERWVPDRILKRRFEPAGYTVEGMIKDLESASRLAKHLGVRELLLQIAQQCYIEAAGLGYDQQDVSSVVKPMETIAGVEVRDDR